MPEACNFIKKETLAQMFSCEFCEISKTTFFYRAPPVAASDNYYELEEYNTNPWSFSTAADRSSFAIFYINAINWTFPVDAFLKVMDFLDLFRLFPYL